MNKKQQLAQQKRVTKQIQELQHDMCLEYWEFYVHFVPDSEIRGSANLDSDGDFSISMCIHPLWEYQIANLLVNEDLVTEWTDQELKQKLIHEFLHVLTSELFDKVKNNVDNLKKWERTIVNLVHSTDRIYRRGFQDGVKSRKQPRVRKIRVPTQEVRVPSRPEIGIIDYPTSSARLD